MFLSSVDFFQKILSEYSQSVKINSLDPDQARHFVRPDLGTNCLQKLSADDTSKQRVDNNSHWIGGNRKH